METDKCSPVPLSEWTFATLGLQDHFGGSIVRLKGKAAVQSGQSPVERAWCISLTLACCMCHAGVGLRVPGASDSFGQAKLSRGLSDKTMIVTVKLHNLDQRGGGAMTVETRDGRYFDSVVFGELQSREWLAGR